MEQLVARRGRFRSVIYLAAAVLVAALLILAFVLHRSRKPALIDAPMFSGDSSGLRQTQVVPTLDTPLMTGKNAIWCAAFQLSWKKLQQDVAGAPVQLQDADAFCKRLNSAADPTADLPVGSFYAAAGWVNKGIVQKVDGEFRAAFPGVSAPTFPGIATNSYLAYAYLQASVKFAIPYFEESKPFAFTDGGGTATGVRAFGIREEDDYAYSELRQQPKLLYVNEEGFDSFNPVEFAVDLCGDSKDVQVVVACTTRGETLAATLEALEAKLHAFPAEKRRGLGINDVLLVPRIEWRIMHHFDEAQGKAFMNSALSQQRMDVATEELQFKLDKGGMELRAEAKHHMKPVPSHYLVNRPFLVFARLRGADRPFFVMWVENAELLTATGGR